jgi:hypothetical protein
MIFASNSEDFSSPLLSEAALALGASLRDQKCGLRQSTYSIHAGGYDLRSHGLGSSWQVTITSRFARVTET